MLGRRRIETSAPIRSSLANAAFAVEERVVWGGADALRRLAEAVKWPFERLLWAIEQGLVWPLEERTEEWRPSVRVLAVAGVALLAVAAGALGLALSAGGGGGAAETRVAAAPVTPPVAQVPKVEPASSAPVLQGAKPDFTIEGGGVARGSAGASAPTTAAATSPNADVASSAPSATTGAAGKAAAAPAGPAAIKVARQFASAFVLYETGRESGRVREAFRETATPQLTRALLQRPPRQPAGAAVPQAKVLNVVAGPRRGDTHTMSVSLLRVGVTSELRITMQRNEKTGQWQVTDSLG